MTASMHIGLNKSLLSICQALRWISLEKLKHSPMISVECSTTFMPIRYCAFNRCCLSTLLTMTTGARTIRLTWQTWCTARTSRISIVPISASILTLTVCRAAQKPCIAAQPCAATDLHLKIRDLSDLRNFVTGKKAGSARIGILKFFEQSGQCFLSRLVGGRRRRKKYRRLFQRTRSPRAINFPPPRLRLLASAFNADREVLPLVFADHSAEHNATPQEPRRRTASVCRLALYGTTFFEEHLADITNCGSQQIAPLILWSEQYQIDEALAHFCNQVGQIDLVIANAFNVLPHHLI